MALIGVIRTKFVVNFLHDFKLLENNLRILIKKKHRQIQIQLFQKVRLWTFGWLVTETKSSKKKKNKVVSGKTLFFSIRSFCIHHSICLNISF